MGRRPNPLIGQYFDRGAKLPDQSNRYPHTCRQCGEHFPRGRLDTLTGHLTKKCPGISESERVNILLSLSGMSKHTQQGQLPHHAPQHGQQLQGQPNGPSADVSMAQHDAQRDWTALGMLAEVSRVFTQVERNDDQVQPQPPGQAAPHASERFELQPQFSEDGQEAQGMKDTKEPVSPEEAEMTPEDRIQDLLRADNANNEPTNLTMAAAATARLQPGLLDPQLLGAEAAAAAAAASAAVDAAVNTPMDAQATSSGPQSPVEQPVSISTPTVAQPWGEITYPTEGYHPQLDPTANMVSPATRGGFRLEANGAKSRHSRQRFTPERREQVKDVRKIGACIRCKILRKTCSRGEPCDTCRKVLSPRIWRSGCCRAKFTEQLDMYQAAVQNVMAQNHINKLKQMSTNLVDRGLVLEAHNFPEHQSRLQLLVLQSESIQEDEAQSNPAGFDNGTPSYSVMMLDEKQDIPAKVEKYMREILPELINQEPSHFVQVTLRQGLELANASNDELLKKAIELWGHVELVNRERQWVMSLVSSVSGDDAPRAQCIKEDTHQEMFTTICLQLTAGAERKASQTSKTLLTGMQRVLQDSKVKMDFNMYLTSMILLNCIEKSTWEFKAWEQPNLRIIWPLPKEPSTFLRQGRVMSDLLRMLLVIRKVQPRTSCRGSDGKLVTDEEDPTIRHYFETINLDFAEVKAKQDNPSFSPTDPRSFEFMFCSALLLPSPDEKPGGI
ncbi:hypothetical protein QBC34DRAFT_157527 [Podospora aff. communis PSN243]|uniref:Zn(2)-C6 fungal-type domain-containing protein n=1 Tax=Podospora aff. communis PSN243 TaxID=3040156 RepID=A0AAV9H5Q9_9PEZI|nr:hypothetical protein QBC34DRAFT_157527 [Podospora aff. communis PSN243]